MSADAIEPEAPEFLLEAEIGQSIASTLRSLRRERSLTLQDVADRAGLSLAMVSKIENAQASPSLRTLRPALAGARRAGDGVLPRAVGPGGRIVRRGRPGHRVDAAGLAGTAIAMNCWRHSWDRVGSPSRTS